MLMNRIATQKQLQQWQEGSQLLQKNKKLLSKIHSQQKKKTLTYQQQSLNRQKSRNKNSRPSSSPVSSISISSSINQLRNISSNLKLKTQKITNRLKYLQTSTSRQQKLMKTARQKFYKINQIRKQSFTQKSFLEKQRKNLLFQHSRTVYIQASKIKTQKSNIQLSQNKLKTQKHQQAVHVKKQRKFNEQLIKQRKQQQKSFRETKVLQVQKQAQLSKLKNQSRSKQKIQRGKLNHKKDIYLEFQKVQKQMKINSKLMKSFETKVMKIYDKKVKEEEQLQDYRNFLGLGKSTGKQVVNTTVKKQTSKFSHNNSYINVKQKDKSLMNKDKTIRNIYSANASKSKKAYDLKNLSSNGFYLTNPQNYI